MTAAAFVGAATQLLRHPAEAWKDAAAAIETPELSRITAPVLMSQGDASPPWFFGIVDRLARAIPGASVQTYRGAGHAPHVTHPDDYLGAVRPFLAGSGRSLSMSS